jgi:hypothetical protein
VFQEASEKIFDVLKAMEELERTMAELYLACSQPFDSPA